MNKHVPLTSVSLGNLLCTELDNVCVNPFNNWRDLIKCTGHSDVWVEREAFVSLYSHPLMYGSWKQRNLGKIQSGDLPYYFYIGYLRVGEVLTIRFLGVNFKVVG